MTRLCFCCYNCRTLAWISEAFVPYSMAQIHTVEANTVKQGDQK